MFIGHVTGYLGSDAKKTQKGYSFNVSTKGDFYKLNP